jgi:quinol monooxygenase YgiN
MKVHKIAEYSVKPEELDTILKAIKNFVEEIRKSEP